LKAPIAAGKVYCSKAPVKGSLSPAIEPLAKEGLPILIFFLSVLQFDYMNLLPKQLM